MKKTVLYRLKRIRRLVKNVAPLLKDEFQRIKQMTQPGLSIRERRALIQKAQELKEKALLAYREYQKEIEDAVDDECLDLTWRNQVT